MRRREEGDGGGAATASFGMPCGRFRSEKDGANRTLWILTMVIVCCVEIGRCDDEKNDGDVAKFATIKHGAGKLVELKKKLQGHISCLLRFCVSLLNRD